MLCAYCGSQSAPSRDHVWPKCFLEKVGRRRYAHYSPKSGKVHGADYVVKDVCANCNNVKLSVLDSYFCDDYERYFRIPRDADSVVEFQYDFDLLLRALLKIAYNTARSAGSEAQPLARLARYVLDGGRTPEGVALVAELVSPTYLPDRSHPSAPPKKVLPTMYRSMRAELSTKHGANIAVRVVAVGSFFFHLLISRDPNDLETFQRAVDEFLSGLDGTVRLTAEATVAVLHSTRRDSLSSMIPLLAAKRIQYRKFFDGRRTKK